MKTVIDQTPLTCEFSTFEQGKKIQLMIVGLDEAQMQAMRDIGETLPSPLKFRKDWESSPTWLQSSLAIAFKLRSGRYSFKIQAHSPEEANEVEKYVGALDKAGFRLAGGNENIRQEISKAGAALGQSGGPH